MVVREVLSSSWGGGGSFERCSQFSSQFCNSSSRKLVAEDLALLVSSYQHRVISQSRCARASAAIRMGGADNKGHGAGATGTGKETREHNPRWFCYFGLLVCSLANFASVVGAKTYQGKGERAFSITVGALSTTICFLVLLFDRIGRLSETFDYKEFADGKLEGWTLVFLIVWWIVGVCLMTRSDGIAYKALNIYFSSWFSLGWTAYTLNEWSAAKDIISFEELTHLSATLSSWYSLLASSLVTMGSAAQIHRNLDIDSRSDASFAVACGAVSLLIALFSILLHYKILRWCGIKPGGMVELTTSLLLNLWWMVGVGVMTKDGGVAATIAGTGCVILENTDVSYCRPGSNLFLSSWTAFLSSMAITIRWKRAQAMRFAQAQETQRRKAEKEGKDSKMTGDTDELADDV